VNVLIVEDELKTAELLKRLIESNSNYSVVKIIDSVEKTVSYLGKNKDDLDLLFLDIQLADGQSFKIFEQIQLDIPVVFCTAYDEYVLQAFKNNGIDYILKPFEDKEIFNALEKIAKLKDSFSKQSTDIGDKIQALLNEKKSYQKTIIVNVGDKMVPIAIEDILLFHLDNEVVRIYCSDSQKYLVIKRLDDIESILDEKQFFRINRQMIISRKAVKEIEQYFNRKVIVKTTIQIPEKAIVSRLKVSPFLSWLEKPI
jgi:DNA-binding LytR/AlgR family response regulator